MNNHSISQKSILRKKNKGTRNRRIGFDAERLYAKRFRDLGYDKCITSRQGSRIHDDSKIDLIFVPFNVQIKAGHQRGMSASKILREMEEKIKENFPEGHVNFNYPKLLIWEKPAGKGRKKTQYNSLVIMTFEDFSKIIKNLKDEIYT